MPNWCHRAKLEDNTFSVVCSSILKRGQKKRKYIKLFKKFSSDFRLRTINVYLIVQTGK